MRKFLFPALALICFSVSAGAQDNVIRVVQPDGSVEEAQMPGAVASPEPSAEPAAKSAPAPSSGAAIEKAIERAVEQADAPPAVKAEKKSSGKKAAPKPKVKKKNAAKKSAARDEGAPVMLPPVDGISRYPASPEKVGRVVEDEVEKEGGQKGGKESAAVNDHPAPRLPEGAEITPEIAKMVALEHAPPARSVDVLPRNYKGKEVFIVRFATDNGPFDVIVDRASGARVIDEKAP